MRQGTANLPLHGGHAPRWLFERMVKMSAEIAGWIVVEQGTAELFRRLSDPVWFQAFGAALAYEDAWGSREPDAVMSFFDEDAELITSAPFPVRGPYKGRARIRAFVTEYLAEEVRMDLTKKQVARNGVAWTVRAVTGDDPANWGEGVVEARFHEGKVKSLRLSAG